LGHNNLYAEVVPILEIENGEEVADLFRFGDEVRVAHDVAYREFLVSDHPGEHVLRVEDADDLVDGVVVEGTLECPASTMRSTASSVSRER
jgi:hypothetical protein